MKRVDFKNITLGLGITILLLAGLILLPGVVLASGAYFDAAGTATVTASATGLAATGMSTYIVQPIDTLSSIAVAHGVTVMNIMNANPQIADPNVIRNGERLNIPAPDLKAGESVWSGYDFNRWPSAAAFLAGLPATGASGTATPQAVGAVTATPGIPATGPTNYTVSTVDTLSSIALAHNVTIMSILQANTSIGNPNIIFPGERITIPAPNLKAGQSIWSGYDFNKYPSAASVISGLPATGASATPAAPGASSSQTPAAPTVVTPTVEPSATPTATPKP